MPIDWASVNWVYVAVLGVLAFFATLVGNAISFNQRVLAAVLSALLFAGLFVRGAITPTTCRCRPRLGDRTVPAAAAPATPPATIPQRPANPVTTISPPPASPPANQ